METEDVFMESDEDEDDVLGLRMFDIHDIRTLTAEESRLDPKLQKLLDNFGQMHSYLNDAALSWTAEDHMASIEKKMVECYFHTLNPRAKILVIGDLQRYDDFLCNGFTNVVFRSNINMEDLDSNWFNW